MSIHDMTDEELAELDEPEVVEEEVKYVLGIDPGGTTGVALLSYTDSTLPKLIYLHQITDGHHGYYDFFEGTIPRHNVDIASEKWKEGGKKGSNHEPLIIEGVQYTIWYDDITYQGAEMKSLIKDDWLREQNLWTPGHRHQMDALIHALVFLRNANHKPLIEALSNKTDEKIAEKGEAESKQLEEGSTAQDEQEAAEGAQEGDQGDLSDEEAEAQAAAQAALEAELEALMRGDDVDAEGDTTEAQAEGDQPGHGAASGDPKGGDIDNSEPNGPGNGQGYEEADYNWKGHTDDSKRKTITKNGAFAGWEYAGDDAVDLFNEKL